MAAIKKSKKADKPGAGLAIALVFFILLAIGLGVWGYYGYDGQDKLRDEAKTAQGAEKAAKTAEKYYQFLAWDYALALGHELDPKKKKEYVDRRKSALEYYSSGKGEFEILEKEGKVADKEVLDKNAQELAKKADGTPAADASEADLSDARYPENYRDKSKAYIIRAAQVEKFADERQESLKEVSARFDTLKKNYDAWWGKVYDKIKDDNEEVIKAARATYKQMDEALANARKLNEQLLLVQEAKETSERNLAKKIKDLSEQLKTAHSDRADGGAVAGGDAREPHALVLDISGFRPLWDRPLGEITAVDLTNGLVHVRPNRNVDQPFKPGLTFLVFARGADGGASGQLKGSLEVVRESNGGSYACRITSFFDVDRGEISLADPSKATGMRLSRNAFKVGDLIFNVFFGSRVALAGVYDLGGQAGGSPAELARQLEATIASLKRRGIEVDAYIDPITGQMKGAITQKTRFLIRGTDIEIPAAPAAKAGEIEEDEKKEEAPADRGAAFEQAMSKMKQQAIEQGLFIISRENFITVIGYYPPRHFGETASITRLPRLPAASTLAMAGIGFIARSDVRLVDFAGEWEGSGWELSLGEEGKAKANLVIDRGGIPEVRLTPAELSLRDGKYVLNVYGPAPMELVASLSVGGTSLQLEDPTGKMSPPKIVLRKR